MGEAKKRKNVPPILHKAKEPVGAARVKFDQVMAERNAVLTSLGMDPTAIDLWLHSVVVDHEVKLPAFVIESNNPVIELILAELNAIVGNEYATVRIDELNENSFINRRAVVVNGRGASDADLKQLNRFVRGKYAGPILAIVDPSARTIMNTSLREQDAR